MGNIMVNNKIENFVSALPDVVMIDDDEDDQYVYRSSFETCNSNLIFLGFSSGQEFFKYSENVFSRIEQLPKIILLDLNLPKSDGLEILNCIQKDSLLRRIPVVILTTSSSPMDVCDCYELGARSYFVKPMIVSQARALAMSIYTTWLNINRI